MSHIIRVIKSKFFIGSLIGAVVFIAVLVGRGDGLFETLELTIYDFFLTAHLRLEPEARVTLVIITEKDIQRLKSWPLKDDALAEALSRIASYGPRAIGLDIYRDMPVPPGTDQLEKVLLANPNIVVVEKFGDPATLGVPPPPILKGTERVGFNDMVVDKDGVLRRNLLFLDDGETAHFSFALKLALLYLKKDGVSAQPGDGDPQNMKLGSVTFIPFAGNDGGYVNADSNGYQILHDFHGAPFRVFSLAELMDGKAPPSAFKDRLVLFGVAAESVKDVFHTPLDKDEAGSLGGSPGVIVHAYAASQFLRAALDGAKPMRTKEKTAETVWMAVWTIAGGGLGVLPGSAWVFMALIAGGMAILTGSCWIAFSDGWWIPLVPPAIGYISAAAISISYMRSMEKAERTLLMRLFGTHVSREVAEDIWRRREEFVEGGRPIPCRLTATVLFTDLKGFSTISENWDPAALMEWLSEYMDAMSRVVMENGGVVNKYIGDAVMAVFGVPLPSLSVGEIQCDAMNAVTCALAMEEELSKLNVDWAQRGLPPAMMRVGIYTGPLVAGSLGGYDRMEYTVIGDTVNTASRLESFDKSVVDPDNPDRLCRILVGEATLILLDGAYKAHRVGEVSLKGKADKVVVYLVTGRTEPP
jgi:adenylate cyclase